MCHPVAGLGIKPGESPVEPRDRRIVQDRVQQVSTVLFEVLLAQLSPVAFRKLNRNRLGGIRILKWFPTLQCLLESGEREAGVDSQESALGVLRLQRGA